MNTEQILNTMIRVFGFEHPYTISVARMIENNVSLNTIQKTVEGLIKMIKL